MKKKIKNIIFYIQYLLIMFFTKLFIWLPEKVRFNIGEFFAILAFKVVKEVRYITLLNLKLAFPEKSNEEIKKLAIESCKTMSRAFFVNMWLDKYLEKDENFKIIDEDLLQEAIDNGPSVFGAMHFGNMEAPVKLANRIPIVTVAKDRTNPYINNLIIKNRTRFNIALLQKGNTTSRDLIKYAKEGRYPILLTDHRDSNGTNITFFGEPTTAPTGVSSIALKYNRPFYLMYCVLTKDNTTEVYIRKIEKCDDESLSFKERVQKTVQNMFNEMEIVMREYPEQWMWSYDRWKLYSQYKKGILRKDLMDFIKNF
ncbi:MAG: lauroyl acyltransferase [Fusobacterium perfoetens]|uniref:lysophospholipid acyltransferase family protein n=1 Tax=Fusobacterium perfoetens TaxID=852 RepID=UPI0023F20B99|nr:lauroyl acyltransferase [Fusobacterium perfoetens]MCI6152959.1 lauroyl acyltransferase [Fusobacterium perfoetens]MDY3237912.1 lauroyl acyltransferase [Fusobacterium perfoetens]